MFETTFAAAADQGEHGDRTRCWNPALVRAARREGLFCLALPKRFGGLQLAPAEIVDVLERLAHVDGSAGWCGFIGNATTFAGWLAPDVAAEHLAGAPHLSAVSVFAPTGRAIATGHGRFVIEGRWSFASGIRHATLVQVGVIADDLGWQFAYLPADVFEVVDTWDTLGLRGTGSHDIVARDVEIDADHLAMPMTDEAPTDEPIYRLGFFGQCAMFMAPFMLGVGRRALDEAERALRDQVTPGRQPTRLDPQAQHALGRARGSMLAARAFLDDGIGRAWERAQDGDRTTADDDDRLQLSLHHAATAAFEAVDVAYQLAPSGVIRRGDVLQRCLRDVQTARKHRVFSFEGTRAIARRALGVDAA